MSPDYTNESPDRSEPSDRPQPAPYGRRKIEIPVVEIPQDADRLRQVAQQVEAFLIRQIDRLQHELEQAETLGDRAELARMTNEFELMRRKWDAERQQERTRIQEDSKRLAEAWQKLEAEQREMLKYRSANGEMASFASGTVARPAATVNPRPPAVGIEPAMVRGGGGGGVATATPTSHKNRLQFQQLRREMMEHARQRGKR